MRGLMYLIGVLLLISQVTAQTYICDHSGCVIDENHVNLNADGSACQQVGDNYVCGAQPVVAMAQAQEVAEFQNETSAAYPNQEVPEFGTIAAIALIALIALFVYRRRNKRC